MPSRREQIKMPDEELDSFLAEERVVTVATIGPNGRPHLTPLWFVPDGTVLSGWTFARSQKAKNLERDPGVREMVEKQAPKRVALRFTPTRTVTWDHRKLGGTY